MNEIEIKKLHRADIQHGVEEFVADRQLLPPITLEELFLCADQIIGINDWPENDRDLIAVYLNNELWKSTVSSIPYERRIMLLPQCLANSEKCSAPSDIYGLLCQKCGACSISYLMEQADSLGISTLVAEGGTVVAGLIETGQVDAVIGVSCLDALEKIFPYMVKHAVPGIAIPLLKDGCKDTIVDENAVCQAMTCYDPDAHKQLQPKDIEREVQSWFSKENLEKVIKSPDNKQSVVVQTAVDWIALDGKRWRPCLAVSAYVAMSNDVCIFSENLKKIAVAIECFHKASLIHDDIEDNDSTRYHQKTLHEKIGVPAALNIGDFLIGEGYKLINELDVDSNIKNSMIAIAAAGHRKLCLGQGEELEWISNATELSVPMMISIFKHKTAPAFQVALSLGVLYAGGNLELCSHLDDFSNAFGVAYQIKDDMEDFFKDNGGDLFVARPSLLLALACESAGQNLIDKIRNGEFVVEKDVNMKFIRNKAGQMYEHYKNQVIRALKPIKHTELRRLLFRLSGAILVDIK